MAAAAPPPPPGDIPVQRFSRRRIRIKTQADAERVMIEGHGELAAAPGAPAPSFAVPDGMEIVIYQGQGVGLDDQDGVDIASGTGVPSRMPTLWDAAAARYGTDPALGSVRGNTPGIKIYRGGEECPNYTLYAHDEPGFGPMTPPQPGSYAAAVGHPVTLQTIAALYDAQDGSFQLHWAACTVPGPG